MFPVYANMFIHFLTELSEKNWIFTLNDEYSSEERCQVIIVGREKDVKSVKQDEASTWKA